MRGRYIYVVILLLFISTTYSQSHNILNWNNDTSFYFYSTDVNAENLIRIKINFENNLDKKEILDSIASQLTSTYFFPKNNFSEKKRKINIRLQMINEIILPERNYYIATVNIEDPDKICLTAYFQGSTGGYITFLILVSNFMQPQLKNPLIDGIVFLYNDAELKMMDHINLEGLISEREIDNIVRNKLVVGQ